jgi:diguanylate cyclase (GGDEF)-like protein
LNSVGKEEGKTVLIRDITETRRLIRTLNQQATTDALTGVYNRRYLIELGEIELEKARHMSLPFTVVLMDLDRFKHINDRMGHAAGDKALQAVAQCFRSGMRASDIVGRYGGDEFSVILSGATEGQARLVLERLQNCIAQLQIQEQGEIFHITASFGGVTCNGRSHVSLDQLLRRADRALYRAKQRGGNTIEWFSAEIDGENM